MLKNPEILNALQTVRRHLPAAADGLQIGAALPLAQWRKALDLRLLPRLKPEFPLIVAICGGGSAGKSTLFNSLVGRAISPTGGKAGLNRRILAGLKERHLESKPFMSAFEDSLGASLHPLRDSGLLLTPGDPVYWGGSSLPANAVLLDTPDIDTGAGGRYTNRELARRSLEAADLFIYIFTNATYNNRDNTDFMAHLLTAVGTRPCFLVYRVYPGFSDTEIRDHAQTVAQNLYGPDYDHHTLGLFRADEDNAVAAGQQPMRLRPVATAAGDLNDALNHLDAAQLREKALRSFLTDGVAQAGQMLEKIKTARDRLDRYLDLLETVQRRCVQQALSHFPSDRVLGRFAGIWLQTDPAHIKIMRQTGRIVEWPYRIVLKAVRGVKVSNPSDKETVDSTDPVNQLEIDLLTAANQLYQASLNSRIQVDAQTEEAPPAVRSAQQRLRRKDWKAAVAHILEQKKTILSWSDQLESELKALADGLRQRMGLLDQVRQTFAALLNVIPATAAITYILHTGDPVGAAGIKVKLTGIFGIKDLYALIAIPATAGMSRADRRQLEMLLGPVAATWLEHKLHTVRALFENQITGEVMAQARAAKQQAEAVIPEIESALSICREAY